MLCQKTPYTVGFLFTPERDRVVLIKKNRPDWQAGKLNGVGGHIEPGEWPSQCMHREFLEETGLDIDGWEKVALMSNPQWIVHVYAAFDAQMQFARTMTDEQIGIYNISDLSKLNVVPNLKFLIPLALSNDVQKPVRFIFKD